MPSDPTISYEEAVKVFQNPKAIESVPFKSQGFVKSLLSSKAKYGKLTPKQSYWLRIYAEKVQGLQQAIPLSQPGLPANVTPGPATPPPAVKVGTKIHEMFKTAHEFVASKGGKFKPKIVFAKSLPKTQVGWAGSPRVGFALAGKASKYAGQIMITDGAKWGKSKFFGRINLQGYLHLSPMGHNVAGLAAFVENFAANPQNLGAVGGQANSYCCFCQTHIDTDESLSVGYGPVCAKKFGLPWGKKAAKAAKHAKAMPIEGHFHTPEITPGAFQAGTVVSQPNIQQVPKVSKWMKSGEAMKEMAKIAKAVGVPIQTATQAFDGMAKAVKATGITEPEDDDQEAFTKVVTSPVTVEPKVAVQATAARPEDFGFACEVCMDTGKDLSPAGVLINCGSCK